MVTQVVPPGRAYALQLPKNLMGDKSTILNHGGLPWVLEHSTGLVCPLEAVCTKVRIPGVTYGDNS